MNASWVVHKFGGTSLADAERYRNVAAIMRAQEGERKAVIVSAMHKVTDTLIELVDLAKARDDVYLARAEALKQRQVDTVKSLLPEAKQRELVDVLDSDFKDIKEVPEGSILAALIQTEPWSSFPATVNFGQHNC